MNSDLARHPSVTVQLAAPYPSRSSEAKSTFFGVLFLFYLGLSLVRFVWPAQLITSFVLTTIALFAFVAISIKTDRQYLKVYLFVLGLIFSILISALFVGRTDRIGHSIIFVLSGAGISLLILRGKLPNWSGYLVFYGVTSYFLMMIISGVDGRDALTATSYNGISVMMLTACIALYAILGIKNKKIDIKPAVFTLIISVWAIGRSGILASLVLLFGILFLKLKLRFKNSVYLLLAIGAAGLIVLIDQFHLSSALDFLLGGAIENYLTRTTQSEPRFIMWSNYFNNLDYARVIFGANLYSDPWPEGEEYAFNYHNTWINLHAHTGLMGLLIIMLVILALIEYFKMNQLFFVLLIVLVIRWSTDIGLFFESWDFLVYFFIFHFLTSKSKRAREVFPQSHGK